MRIFTRTRFESLIISNEHGECLITVLGFSSTQVGLLINQSLVLRPGRLVIRELNLGFDELFLIDSDTSARVIDFKDNLARIGITAKESSAVHDFEDWKRDRHKQRPPDDDPNTGSAGAPVPKPSHPKPPSLGAHRDPHAADH